MLPPAMSPAIHLSHSCATRGAPAALLLVLAPVFYALARCRSVPNVACSRARRSTVTLRLVSFLSAVVRFSTAGRVELPSVLADEAALADPLSPRPCLSAGSSPASSGSVPYVCLAFSQHQHTLGRGVAGLVPRVVGGSHRSLRELPLQSAAAASTSRNGAGSRHPPHPPPAGPSEKSASWAAGS